MKELSIDDPRLKRELGEAFQAIARRSADENMTGERFNFAVMAEIRQIAKASAATDRFQQIPNIVWRLAPVACGILFALTIVFMRYDPALDYDMAALLLTDPIGFTGAVGFHETNLLTF